VIRKLLATAAVALLTLTPVFAVHAQPNEPADAQEQSEMTASVGDSPAVPYHPDPRLSDKAASVQSLYDYWIASTSAAPCNLPHYTKSMSDRIWDKIYERLRALFPDGRDNTIAFSHLERHAGPHITDCSTLKVRLDQLKSATGFSNE
jgi:hypothetical protein